MDPLRVEAFLCTQIDQLLSCKSQDVLASICQAIGNLDVDIVNINHEKLKTEKIIAKAQNLLDTQDKGWSYIFAYLVKLFRSQMPKKYKSQLKNLLDKGISKMPDVSLNICIRSMVKDLPLWYTMNFSILQHLSIKNYLEKKEIVWMKTEFLWQMLSINLNDCQISSTTVEVLLMAFLANLSTVLKSYPNLTPICLDLVTMLLAREVLDEKLSMLACKHGSALLKDDALLVKIVPRLVLLVEQVTLNLYNKDESEIVQGKLSTFVAVFLERAHGLQEKASGVLNNLFQSLSSCCNKNIAKKIMILAVVEEAVHHLKNSPFLNHKCIVLNGNQRGWKNSVQATPREALLALLRQLKSSMDFLTSKRITGLINIIENISLEYLELDSPHVWSLKKSLFDIGKMLEQAKVTDSHAWFSLWVKHSRDFASKECTADTYAKEALELSLELVSLPFTFIYKGGDFLVLYTENGREAVVQTLASLLLAAVKTSAKVATEKCRKQITKLYSYLETLLCSKEWQSAEDLIIHQILCEMTAVTSPRLHKSKIMKEVAASEIRLSLKLAEFSSGIIKPNLISLSSISMAVLWQASYIAEQDDFVCFMRTITFLLNNCHFSYWLVIKNNVHTALKNLLKQSADGAQEKLASDVLSIDKYKLLHFSILSCVYHFDKDIRSVGNEMLAFAKKISVDLERSENTNPDAMQGSVSKETSLAPIQNEDLWALKPLTTVNIGNAVAVSGDVNNQSNKSWWLIGFENGTTDRKDEEFNMFDDDMGVKKRRMTYSDSKTIAQAMKLPAESSVNGESIIDALNLVDPTQVTSNYQDEAITTIENLSIGSKRKR